MEILDTTSLSLDNVLLNICDGRAGLDDKLVCVYKRPESVHFLLGMDNPPLSGVSVVKGGYKSKGTLLDVVNVVLSVCDKLEGVHNASARDELTEGCTVRSTAFFHFCPADVFVLSLLAEILALVLLRKRL